MTAEEMNWRGAPLAHVVAYHERLRLRRIENTAKRLAGRAF